MANILKETVRGIDCVRIEDELLSGREIFLTEEVNAATSNELLKQLMYLDRNGTGEEITLSSSAVVRTNSLRRCCVCPGTAPCL